MAIDIILDIGTIEGESKVQGFEGKIDVLSFSGGASNQGTYSVGGGGGSGSADVQDISISKYYDKSSVPMMKACLEGNEIGDTKFTFRKQGGTDALEYLTITLTKAKVTSVQTSGSHGGDERPIESVSFNFKKIKYEYKQQGDDMASTGTSQYTWDVAARHEA